MSEDGEGRRPTLIVSLCKGKYANEMLPETIRLKKTTI